MVLSPLHSIWNEGDGVLLKGIEKLLKQGYQYYKLLIFSKFYHQYYELISNIHVGHISLLSQGLSEPEFYGNLLYRLKKIVGTNTFSAQFIKIISHYRKIGYNINVLRQTACLVDNQITVGNFAFLFNCMLAGQTSDSVMVLTYCWISFASVFSCMYC